MAKDVKPPPSHAVPVKEKNIAIAPLSGGFMIFRTLGSLLPNLNVYLRMPTFGFAFAIFFTLMFAVGMISMTLGLEEIELLMEYPTWKN